MKEWVNYKPNSKIVLRVENTLCLDGFREKQPRKVTFKKQYFHHNLTSRSKESVIQVSLIDRSK